MAEKYAPAQVSFGRAAELIREDNLLRATAWFGEGRALLAMGRADEGRKALERLFESEASGIDDVRTAALAYLLASEAR
jgi:hypothetical protein